MKTFGLGILTIGALVFGLFLMYLYWILASYLADDVFALAGAVNVAVKVLSFLLIYYVFRFLEKLVKSKS